MALEAVLCGRKGRSHARPASFFVLPPPPPTPQVAESSKTRKAEVAGIQELLQGYGLSRPQMRLVLHCDAQPAIAWSKAPASSPKQAVAAIFGAPLARALEEIDFTVDATGGASGDADEDDTAGANAGQDALAQDPGPGAGRAFHVQGLVPQPGSALQVVARTTGDRYFIFVNGRPVQLPEVGKAARQAWKQGEKTRYHPFVYLNIAVPQGGRAVGVARAKVSL